MGNALLTAAVVCVLLQQVYPLEFFGIVMHSFKNVQNWLLTCIILSILIFAHSMSKTDYANRFIKAYQSFSPNVKFNLMMIPAFIGLLPMPGGAIFSAPFVERLSEDTQVPRSTQAIVNYWFRHCFEFSWPLYPGLILAAHLAQTDLFYLISFQIPFTLLAFYLGYHAYIKPLQMTILTKKTKRETTFIKEVAPIGMVLILAVFGKCLLPSLPREVNIGLAVWMGILWIWIKERINLHKLKEIFTEKTLLKVLYAVFGIFVFKQTLNETQIVTQASKILVDYHIPLGFIAALLPLLTGLIIGLTLAFVGVTFPLIVTLIHTMHVPHLPYVVLAFVCGVIGVLLSPMHLCFVLSLEYFQVRFDQIHRKLYRPCFVLLLAAGICFFLLKGYNGPCK